MKPIELILIYIAIVSIITVAANVYDKIAAKHFTKHRVRESHLLLLAAIGGALAMYLTMITIRHKTQKPKFSVGVPLMIICHLAIFVFLFVKGVI